LKKLALIRRDYNTTVLARKNGPGDWFKVGKGAKNAHQLRKNTTVVATLIFVAAFHPSRIFRVITLWAERHQNELGTI
jgi:hypothetical protein